MNSQFQLSLQRAGHGRLTLPVEAQEFGARDFKRRRFRICAVATLAMMLVIFAIFVWAGFFPGVYRGLLTNPPTNFGLTLFVFILALPLGAGLLLFWLMHATAPKVADDAEYPCHYRATEQGSLWPWRIVGKFPQPGMRCDYKAPRRCISSQVSLP